VRGFNLADIIGDLKRSHYKGRTAYLEIPNTIKKAGVRIKRAPACNSAASS